jgi:hypothetical protein
LEDASHVKDQPVKDEKAVFYAIHQQRADTFINSLILINIAPQHASILAIALAKLIVAAILGAAKAHPAGAADLYPGPGSALTDLLLPRSPDALPQRRQGPFRRKR